MFKLDLIVVFLLGDVLGVFLILTKNYFDALEKGGLIALLGIVTLVLYKLFSKSQKDKDKLYKGIIKDKDELIKELKSKLKGKG